MKEIFKNLNPAQVEAVKNTDGPMMVIAGAGSGKTRVLTHKVAYLITLGADPFNILALTFTNKASRVMKERIIELVGSDGRNVWMGTFHSIFARILRIESDKIGYPSNFTIYDTDDSKSLIRTIIKEKGLDKQVYTTSYVLGRISAAKTRLISHEAYANNPEFIYQDQAAGKPKTAEIYSTYQNRCFKAAAMDFDDLLYKTFLLLENHPDTLYKYQHHFRHILVDEYQDTNHAQYMIIRRLAANNENICVVGDDAQSIYGFRGASIQNILDFKSDYPDYRLFKLEQNYRSTKSIVNAANSIIVNNKNQIPKVIWTQNDAGSKIKLMRAASDNEEGSLVANAIFERKMNDHIPNDAFAILYRTNAQSRAFEESLRRINIPYRIYGGLSFYNRREIKDLLAYFRLVVNPKDEEALKRIINYPTRGIGSTTMQKLAVAAESMQMSMWEIIENPEPYELKINSGTLRKLQEFATMITSFRIELRKKDAFNLARQIANASGILREMYQDKSVEGINRFENLEELLNGIKDFTERERTDAEITLAETQKLPDFRTLDEFLKDIALLTDADKDDKDDIDKVSLMTVHAAKGLEFPHVFIVGLEENLFPSIQSMNSRTDLEEERRLFYVALTRAEKSATLSYAETRYRWGNLNVSESSRFLEEIDEQYIEFPKKSSIPGPFDVFADPRPDNDLPNIIKLKKKNFKKVKSSANAVDTASAADIIRLQPGMKVEHEKFGKGKVISVEGSDSNKKATVFFKKAGNKNLLLKFAKLKILGS